jgi:hypothetical protein
MLSLVKKMAFGLRKRGPTYLARALRNEMAGPRFRVTQGLRKVIVWSCDRLFHRQGAMQSFHNLRFFYDLDVAPITFDFVSYLAGAELERRRLGFDALEVIFVPGRSQGVRGEFAEYDSVVNTDSRNWRVRNLLLPILSLLPSAKSYRICASRDEADALAGGRAVFPADYRVFLPRYPAKRLVHDLAATGASVLPMMRAPAHAKRIAEAFIARVACGRKAIVVTMREYAYTPARNSKIDAWRAFADGLDAEAYVVIFVPDTEAVMRANYARVGDHPMCEAAAWNIEVRMALYEAAWLNMGVMQGPMELCWYSESTRYLIFLNVGNSDVSSEAIIAESGQPLYRDLAFARPFQTIVWADDDLATLSQNFAAAAARLQAAASP